MEELLERIERFEACVGIVGLGYVGLPLAVTVGQAGFRVVGIDLSPRVVDTVNAGRSHIGDVRDEDISALRAAGRLRATTDYAAVAGCDVVIICVPTPLDRNRQPDISYILAAGKGIAAHMRPGQLVSLESTTYPGTTEEDLLPVLEKSGLKVGRDFFLCFSPERVDPGSKRWNTRNTPKVVGGLTPACREVAVAFYSRVVETVVPVSSPRVAEMTKIFENTFRVVNMAVVNEMAMLCDRMGLNIWEVIEAASTKPFGFMPFYPGPGVGGHCIPIDPFYLTWKAREYDFHTRFIELAGEINLAMPYFVREKVIRALNERGKALKGARILVLGLAYKADVADWRESPAFDVIRLLEEYGATVHPHDPLLPEVHDPHEGIDIRSVELTDELIAACDCVVIVTHHSAYDYQHIVDLAQMVVDTRNATRGVTRGREKIFVL
ncbi:MAG: nucleotide sugar dehydrogenase [Chloroflexia bacterium]